MSSKVSCLVLDFEVKFKYQTHIPGTLVCILHMLFCLISKTNPVVSSFILVLQKLNQEFIKSKPRV